MNGTWVAALLLLGVAVVGTSAAFTSIVYKDCKSEFKVNSVEADGCPLDGDKCSFKRGSKPIIRINFTPNRDVDNLKATVRSKLQSTTFTTFPLNPDDACAAGNLTCPLKAGQDYWYSQSVEIVDSYPLVDDVQVNWVLADKAREVCIVFLAKIIA